MKNTKIIGKKYTGQLLLKVESEAAIFLPTKHKTLKSMPLFLYLGPQGSESASIKELAWSSPHRVAPQEIKDIGVFGSIKGKKSIYDPIEIAFLIKQLTTEYNIDPKKIYLMGFSYGARWCYNVALQFPDLFAGLVTFAGYSNYIAAPRISHIPTLILHATNDEVVPFIESQKMHFSLNSGINRKSKLIKYETGGHGCHFGEVMSRPAIYHWMLSQSR